MRRYLALSLALLASGCAMPGTVQRIGVGYNNAVANLTDELTLLNIVRARNGYPLHYTSLSRLSGSITLKVTGGFNAQVKGAQPTRTNTVATTQPSAGAAATSIVSTVTNTVLSGGNQYTPSVGGEVDTNPTFDVDVNDTQDFYRGITSSIEPETIQALIDQGYGANELLALMISRVDFTLKKESHFYAGKVGARVDSIVNDGVSDGGKRLSELLACYRFQLAKGDATELAPLSRITTGREKNVTNLSMSDLALLDGTKLDLVGKATKDPNGDKAIKVVRPAAGKVAQIVWQGNLPNTACSYQQKLEDDHGVRTMVYEPTTPPPDTTFVGDNKVAVIASNAAGRPDRTFVDVDISMIVRSPEALIRFLGNCLKVDEHDANHMTCTINNVVLLELRTGAPGANDVSTQFGRDRYYIPAGSAVSLRTLGLIEELLDLHKSAADKVTTTPVRIISQ